MQRLELRQFVRDMTLVEQHEASDVLLDRFLKEAYDKVIHRRKWSWLLQVPELIVSTGAPFDLSTLTVPLISIYDLSPTAENQISLHQITRSDATFFLRARPLHVNRTQFYWVEGKTLYCDPEPDAGEEWIISYYGDPGWADGDNEVPTVIPEHWHTPTLANYAIHRLWERQEDLDRSDAYLGRYEVGISEMITEENTTNSDRPKIFGELTGAKGRARNMPWLDGV